MRGVKSSGVIEAVMAKGQEHLKAKSEENKEEFSEANEESVMASISQDADVAELMTVSSEASEVKVGGKNETNSSEVETEKESTIAESFVQNTTVQEPQKVELENQSDDSAGSGKDDSELKKGNVQIEKANFEAKKEMSKEGKTEEKEISSPKIKSSNGTRDGFIRKNLKKLRVVGERLRNKHHIRGLLGFKENLEDQKPLGFGEEEKKWTKEETFLKQWEEAMPPLSPPAS